MSKSSKQKVEIEHITPHALTIIDGTPLPVERKKFDKHQKKTGRTVSGKALAEQAKDAEATEEKPKKKNCIYEYMDLVETVARVEYSRLPNHLIDFSELVNIGAIALHVLFTSNPDKEFNVTYLSTAMKWAIRNELRYRYKWYALKFQKEEDTSEEENFNDGFDAREAKEQVRATVYETILSVDSMMDSENPHEVRDENYTPEEQCELSEAAKIVRAAIAKLPPREKQVLEARFYKNLKMREIGTLLGISPSRTSRVVQSGLDKVKLELEKAGYVY